MSLRFNQLTGQFDKMTDIYGTTNQISATKLGDKYTLATPQDIHTGATPQFQDMQVLGTGLGNRYVGKTLAQLSSTGVISGLVLSINADPAKFDLSAGTYEIVDNYTDPSNPVVTPVTYAGSTANVVTNLATAPASYILLDSSGVITQQTTYPTPSERRAKALVGRVTHQNNTSITFANSFPDVKNGIVSQFYDLCDAMAPFKIGGLVVTANGANLSFDRSAGSVFFRSNSWTATPSNPHNSMYSAQVLQPFRKATQTMIVDGSDVTVIDPTSYDNAGTVTTIPASNNATIQRVYLYKSGGIRVFYGQTVYSNFAQAVSGINQDPFVVNPTVEQSAVLIAYIIATKSATNLTNTTNTKIITAARFDAGGSAASGGVTTLQQAYLNSVLPQIVLNSTQGAFTIDDALTPIGSLFQVRDNPGTTTYFGVNAAGLSGTAAAFSGNITTSAGKLGVGNTSPQKNVEISAAADPTLRLSEASSTTSYFDIIDNSATQSQIKKVSNSGSSSIDIDPVPTDGTSTSTLRLFRNLTTSGARNLTIFKGDGTSTSVTSISANSSSYINADGAALGIGTSSPNANAALDVTSTTKAFMPPRMTTTQKNAISSPTAGMVVYDTTLNKICTYNGSAWETNTSITSLSLRAYLSADQTGINPNNSYVKINFNADDFDASNAWDTSTYKFTAPTTDVYRISAFVYLAGTNVLANNYALAIYKNGSLSQFIDADVGTTGVSFGLTGSTLISLAVTDTVEIYLRGVGNNSSSTLTANGSSNGSYVAIDRIN